MHKGDKPDQRAMEVRVPGGTDPWSPDGHRCTPATGASPSSTPLWATRMARHGARARIMVANVGADASMLREAW